MEYNLKKLVASMWEHRNNNDFERKSLESSYRGLSVKASIGMTGKIANIPWISYCAEGQETQKGIYPVLLFYGTPEFIEKNKNQVTVKKIVLAYGVSATKKPDILWGAEVRNKKTIGDIFVDWNYKTSDYGIKKYNSSYVYKTYDWTDDVDYENIQKDVDSIIDIYLKILSGSNTNSEKDGHNMNKSSEELTEKNENILNFLDVLPSQIIYYGAPGTGKSYTIRKKEKEGLRCIRTTFHPDCDYATFVGCYKPYLSKELNKLIYKFVEQSFLVAYAKAWLNPQQEIALVIEEINRGNCAQIFGDIFQLLDRDDDGWSTYPIKADTDISEHLEELNISGYSATMANRYGKDKAGYNYMALPPNMSFLATMNTSDQSLFPIDSAFKRRWDWQYMPIANGFENWYISIEDYKFDWWQFLQKINKLIGATTHSEDKKLGYYFCKAKNKEIDANLFVSKVIFYLWNDVFKDYEFANSVFDDIDGNKLTFDKFYTTINGNAIVVEDKVVMFLNKLDEVIEKEYSMLLPNVETTTGLSGNDFTNYSFEGSAPMGKSELGKTIMLKYLNENAGLTFDEIKAKFPDSLLGSVANKGLIVKDEEDLGSYQRYYVGGFTSADGVKFKIYKQWTVGNIQNIKNFAFSQGWSVEEKGSWRRKDNNA